MKLPFLTGTLCLALAGCSVSNAMRITPEQGEQSVAVQYDEFKNQSSMTGHGAVLLPGNQLVFTRTWFSAPGRDLRTPDQMLFLMEMSNYKGDWQFLRNSELIFLTNRGDRISLGQAQHDGAARAVGTLVRVREVLGYRIPVSDLRRLAVADTVRARVGNTEFLIPGDQAQVQVWRALVRRLDALPTR